MVVHAYYPHGETRVERQAQALLAQGTKVDLICLRIPGEPACATVNGVEVHRLPVKRRGGSLASRLLEYLSFFVLAFIRLTSLHLRRRYDVVQIHNLPDFLVFAALIPKLTGARVILDLHDLMPEFYAEDFQRSLDSLPVRLIRWQEWLACHFADRIITVTELWRQRLIKRGQPADKITVVMNVADDRIFFRDMTNDAQSQSRDNGRLDLIYHGAMAPRHGLDLVLKAIALIKQTAPSVHITFQGGGEKYRCYLADLAQELGLEDRVHFGTHFVPTVELPTLLKRADLAVVPYQNGVFAGEILPTKLMEYAALGMPAIAARTPAIAAYFEETTVQFFTPGDVDDLAHCILELYQDRSRLNDLARNITEFSKRYNWPAQRANYLKLMEQLIERGD